MLVEVSLSYLRHPFLRLVVGPQCAFGNHHYLVHATSSDILEMVVACCLAAFLGDGQLGAEPEL